MQWVVISQKHIRLLDLYDRKFTGPMLKPLASGLLPSTTFEPWLFQNARLTLDLYFFTKLLLLRPRNLYGGEHLNDYM